MNIKISKHLSSIDGEDTETYAGDIVCATSDVTTEFNR